MTTFYAQPYDVTASGFYFEDVETYLTQNNTVTNEYGESVEEFELQFIDGDDIDSELANALGLYQNTILKFMNCIEGWDDDQKLKVAIAVGECGYQFDYDTNDPDDFDLDIYPDISMRHLAEQFVDEGVFGDIADAIINYIDYEAIARDLVIDYTETIISGQRYIYRCS